MSYVALAIIVAIIIGYSVLSLKLDRHEEEELGKMNQLRSAKAPDDGMIIDIKHGKCGISVTIRLDSHSGAYAQINHLSSICVINGQRICKGARVGETMDGASNG